MCIEFWKFVNKIVRFFFFSQASSHLWKLVDANQPEDKLLRVVTCLANIVCNSSIGIGVRRQAPTPTSDKTTFLNGASAGGTSLISQQYVKFVFIYSSITLILNLWNMMHICTFFFNFAFFAHLWWYQEICSMEMTQFTFTILEIRENSLRFILVQNSLVSRNFCEKRRE